MITKFLIVFVIAMVPLIELRGAIPVGVGLFQEHLQIQEGGALPVELMLSIIAVAMIGNMVPVPFIYLFARRFLEWGQDKKFIGGICRFFLIKGQKGGEKLKAKAGNGLFLALTLFVGIPLPGTGAWTGTLAASMLDMDFKSTILAVLCGVVIAAVIMSLASMGVFGAASSFLANTSVAPAA